MQRLNFSFLVSLSSILFLFGLTSLQAQLCEVNITTSPEHFCRGEMVTLSAENSAMTLSNPEDSLNFHRGVMFDLQALQTIVIEDFFVRPKQLTDVEVYYKIGSYDSWENTPSVWTLLGSVYNIPGAPDPVALGLGLELEIPAGQVYGFYITSTDPTVSMYYNNGSGEGVFVTGDSQISLISGGGLEYPFGGTGGGFFQPRDFYGSIVYKANADFTWSDGSTGETITVTAGTATTHSVTASFPDLGCSETVSLEITGSPAQLLPTSTYLCLGDPLVLTAGTTPGQTYNWSNGETTPSIELAGDFLPAGSAANFSVTIDDGLGCVETDAVEVAAVDPPLVDLPENLDYCLGSNLSLDAGGGAGFSYTWMTGDTSQQLDLADAGFSEGVNTVSVIVQSPEGCTSSGTALVMARVCTGIDEPTNELSIYPNPVRNRLYLSSAPMGSSWQILDLNGRIIQQGKLGGSSIQKQPLQIAVAEIPAGTFLLRIQTSSQTLTGIFQKIP